MKALGKKAWEYRHGVVPFVLDIWREYGFNWGPAMCHCEYACSLKLDEKTKRGKT